MTAASTYQIEDRVNGTSCDANTVIDTPKGKTPIKLSINTELRASKEARVDTPTRNTVGRWTPEEHQLFLDGLEKHGKSWKKIAQMIQTRTLVQIRTHAQKYLQKQQWNENGTTNGLLGLRSPSTIGVKRASPHIIHHPMFFPIMPAENYMIPPTVPWDSIPDEFDSFNLDGLFDDVKIDDSKDSLPIDKNGPDTLPLSDVQNGENLDWLADCITSDLEAVSAETPSVPEFSMSLAKSSATPLSPDSGMKKRRLQPATARPIPTPIAVMPRMLNHDAQAFMWARHGFMNSFF